MRTDVSTPAPLRGRHQEWAQVTAALRRAGQGHRTLLVIEGQPGTGETRLLRETVEAARLRQCPVFEHQGWMPPAAVRQTVTECEWLAGQLARLSGATARGPVVVAWDEPRWTDRGMMEELGGAASAAAPILWALTRPADAPRIADVSEASAVVCVELGPLSDAAVAEILTDLLNATPSEDLLALAAAASGNPGAIVDLVSGVREDALLAVENGIARLTSITLPSRVHLRLRRRLMRMSPQARQLVQVASAVGVSFTLLDVADLMRGTAAGLLPAVEEALTSGLLVPAGERLAFGHELVRAVVAESLPVSVHRALRDEVGRQAAARSSSSTSHRGGWDSLSATERTVALLVNQALTNRQIAARMFLSPHTVNYHLRQIFRKLDIHSKAELIRFTQVYLSEQDIAQAS